MNDHGTARAIDLAELTVEQVQAGFASGTFTAEALTEASLDRIAAYNPRYNAIIFLNPEALADARAIDKRRAAGEALGPLAGVPVVIKDTMDMVGFPTTGGWSLLYGKKGGVDLMPAADSPVVARMRAAGAVLLGKTNVPVLSHSGTHANDSWAGPTLNAVMPDRAPGASSAGTATAVAAAMAVLGLAEETGGSIQNPASAQGLVGIKPSLGLVPNAGVMPLSGNRDVVGPIARCVRDAALCLDVLAGYSAEDPKTIAGVGQRPRGGYTARLKQAALAGKRIGLHGPGWRDQPLSEETTRLYARAQSELEAQGAILDRRSLRRVGLCEACRDNARHHLRCPRHGVAALRSHRLPRPARSRRRPQDLRRLRQGDRRGRRARTRWPVGLSARPAAICRLPRRSVASAGSVGVHGRQGGLSQLLRRGVRAPCAWMPSCSRKCTRSFRPCTEIK